MTPNTCSFPHSPLQAQAGRQGDRQTWTYTVNLQEANVTASGFKQTCVTAQSLICPDGQFLTAKQVLMVTFL